MSTPLEREILTHYYTRPGPFRDGSENWTPLIKEIVDLFIDLGLLVHKTDEKGFGFIEANQAALEVYMEALSEVPYPERRWTMPTVRRNVAP